MLTVIASLKASIIGNYIFICSEAVVVHVLFMFENSPCVRRRLSVVYIAEEMLCSTGIIEEQKKIIDKLLA